MAVVHDYIREDNDLVIGDGDVGQWHGWEGEAFLVVVEAISLDDRVAAGDGDGDGHVNGVCVAGAGGCAGDLVDGDIVAGALEAALHEDGGGGAVPYMAPPSNLFMRPVAPGMESVPLGWAGLVDGSQGEFADSSVHGGALVADWVAKAWFATDGHPFVVDISVD